MTGRLAAIFGCAGPELTADERAFFHDADPFGFILFGRNVIDPAQLRRLAGALRDAVGRDAPVLIDQEGGRVQRLRAPHWREWTPPLDMVAQARDPARAMWLRSRIIAHELRGVGVDANCAPCADIAGVDTHPFLKNRCYGTDVALVSRISAAVASGHLAGGVLPVIKHLPGHGRATADTHHDLPTVTASREDLSVTDFAPFKALNHLPMAMTAHIIFAAYDDKPATQSPEMLRVIRDEIGFQGLLMTDDLNMQALRGTLADRTAASMAAGCDIALHCKGDMAEMLAVAAACGDQTPAIRQRAQAALAQRHAPDPVDIQALEAELRGVMSGDTHV
ncbi:MAG: glycoside hydrolase family 3 protein [Pseudotabrizicola sp.]|uniref:glycoside hydrolase family 3 N-terminal domain-containing protein n=1 Tax=Pseudotabrizicola sp. TaxID=2939647 RepID=UPI00271C5C17|nr:glycoside hydrolase family 3 protein [Pseudotabrizicola sp.]MDO8883539.1 glycoside hydrolase family 3 protein [Pseudotabrizicola sp.]MDP2083187.1 glycoside hydrolase family 3 protein [Pseudotabrizicola sp.]MDZ7572604.1 glycoside hydrolase family 3 protein [Pseudotabrizicola sp.]